MSNARERKGQILRKAIEKLWEDYEAAINQSVNEIAVTDQNKSKRGADEIFERIEALNKELADSESAPSSDFDDASKPDPGNLHRAFQENLPKIDFEDLEKALQEITKKHNDGGCAALLLFQQSLKMGGDWCSKRIQQFFCGITAEGKFRYIPFQHQFHIDFEEALLNRIGQEYKVNKTADDELQIFSLRIIQKICNSLTNGDIVLIECRGCDLELESDRLHWIIENFWQPLVQRLRDVAKNYGSVKIFIAMFTDDSVSKKFLGENHYCSLDHFQKSKLLEIPLSPWSFEEIKQWLDNYCYLDITQDKVNSIAKKIYRSSDNGFPNLVEPQLAKICCPESAN